MKLYILQSNNHLAGLYIKVPVMQPTLVSPRTPFLRASCVRACKTLAFRYCDFQVRKKKKLQLIAYMGANKQKSFYLRQRDLKEAKASV